MRYHIYALQPDRSCTTKARAWVLLKHLQIPTELFKLWHLVHNVDVLLDTELCMLIKLDELSTFNPEQHMFEQK